MKHFILSLFLACYPVGSCLIATVDTSDCPVVDTGQAVCYDNFKPMSSPEEGEAFAGQDAQYQGLQPAYRDNMNGTVTDYNTGLTWSKACDARKVSLEEALEIAQTMTLGGHDDWRVPTIKELYSLIDFRGCTGMSERRMNEIPASAIPYINTDFFDFRYGDVDRGERFIDAQWLSCTVNVSPVMGGMQGVFGVNFADGRIKCYPMGPNPRGHEKRFYVRFVRGMTGYGENQLEDHGDGTVTDVATGLTWMKLDSQAGMTWEEALSYAEQLEFAGHDDWRLPNAKELQSLVDYSRSPDATGSAAIDPVFECSPITNEAGMQDYPFYWTSTTHVDGPNAGQAVYVAFGRGIGEIRGRVMDVHGAGAQRSDPKEGEAGLGHGPQGDAQRVLNYVRVVRGGLVEPNHYDPATESDVYPLVIRLGEKTYIPEPMRYTRLSPHQDHGPRPVGSFPPPPMRGM